MAITHDFVTLDSCDDPTLWTPTGQGAVSLNTTDYKQGTGAINVYKSGASAVDFGASKTIAPTDFRGKVLVIWFYFNSKATLDLLKPNNQNFSSKVSWDYCFACTEINR